MSTPSILALLLKKFIIISFGHPWVIWLMGRQRYRRLVPWSSEIDSNLRAGWRKLAKETECRDNVHAAASVPGTA